MNIFIYLGPRYTDLTRVFECLNRNTARLLEQGILIADPVRAHKLIGEMLQVLDGQAPTAEMREGLLGDLLDGAQADRIVICDDGALGPVLQAGGIFPMAGQIASALRGLFDGHTVTFGIGLRNPATFLPAAFAGNHDDFNGFLNGTDPQDLRWSDTVERLRDTSGAEILAWMSEDSPLLWPEILTSVAGCAPKTDLKGMFDFPNALMTGEGVAALEGRLERQNFRHFARKQRAIQWFLSEHAREDLIEQEIDIPGWDAAYIEALTASYQADMVVVAAIDGVTLIKPEAG